VEAPILAPMPEVPAMTAPRAIAVEPAAIAAAMPVSTPASTPAPAPAHEPIVAPRFDAAYLDNAPPAYPTLARQYREQGVVMLNVRVTASGRADAVEIRKSSGSPRLDDAARAAVSNWRFIPARQGDTAITAWVVVPVRFSLNG
jgi:protein TonB